METASVSQDAGRTQLCGSVLKGVLVLLTHLTEDPLADENYGPTENLHVTFLMADHPHKKTTRLRGST